MTRLGLGLEAPPAFPLDAVDFGQDDLDEVAQLLHEVLSATKPAGSKAKYDLDAAVADRVRSRAAELTAAHPLYSEIDITG